MFHQLIFIAFLSSVRIPSESLQLRRDFLDDPIAEFAAQDEKALIGTRPFDGADALGIKLSWRKNLDGGCILRRTCLCNIGSRLGARIPPPHRIWPLIRDRVQPGELIPNQYNKHDFDENLKSALRKLKFRIRTSILRKHSVWEQLRSYYKQAIP